MYCGYTDNDITVDIEILTHLLQPCVTYRAYYDDDDDAYEDPKTRTAQYSKDVVDY